MSVSMLGHDRHRGRNGLLPSNASVLHDERLMNTIAGHEREGNRRWNAFLGVRRV